jgi:sulfite exporter TauE/SafE
MFEHIVDPASQINPTPAERRQFRVRFGIGTVLFCVGVLLQLAHDYSRSPFFVHSRILVIVLMTVGVALQFSGARWLYSQAWHSSKKH